MSFSLFAKAMHGQWQQNKGAEQGYHKDNHNEPHRILLS